MANKSNIFYLRIAAGNYEYATDILADYMRTAGYTAALDLVESIQKHPAFSVRSQYEKTIGAGVFLKAQLQLNPPILQKIANNVLSRGYHLINVLGDSRKEQPTVTYSVGLFHSFCHPEIVMFGVPRELSNVVLDTLIKTWVIEQKQGFMAGETYRGLTNRPAEFTIIPQNLVDSHLTGCRWFYSNSEFPVLECIWGTQPAKLPKVS
ncbi:DUF4262 domain-containing protein [Ancylothrix sp. C2]|uniref:DUF4262 domain-containing protein n=1 Tax=Ancylothrix sp. D3o TaxID=2953691 RepID=UPI0021BB5F65|nr:DUF4262 domain-containing protein [Ancylothrix sp. D3o]MCT7952939.1 DUF4262 domain-containing protein [Ancylothrix sp. D3o]